MSHCVSPPPDNSKAPCRPMYRQLGPFFQIPDCGMVGFRAWGWQFDVTDHRVMPPLFGERQGYDRPRHLGPFCFRAGRLRRGPVA